MAQEKEDMQKLQQDAYRRVMEMQSRARQHVEQPEVPAAKKAEPEKQFREEPEHREPGTDIFKTLFQDKERSLILILILLLSSEKSDTGLVFVLMYLIL